VPAHAQTMPIRFADIDALNHVNHAVALTYCETVRCDWFAANGWPSMGDLPFIIASAHIEYKAPIPKTADLEVAMTVPKVGTKSWEFDYALRDRTTAVVFATAKTVQVAYDYKSGKTVEIPAGLRTKLAALA
jgi:acyl-CoA thioester hydrolase